MKEKSKGNKKGGAKRRPRALFSPGVIFITRGVQALLDDAKLEAKEVCSFIDRHLAGDWGDLDGHDRRRNAEALQDGARLFSAYRSLAGTKFWVITEAEIDKGYRESTCVMLPDEY